MQRRLQAQEHVYYLVEALAEAGLPPVSSTWSHGGRETGERSSDIPASTRSASPARTAAGRQIGAAVRPSASSALHPRAGRQVGRHHPRRRRRSTDRGAELGPAGVMQQAARRARPRPASWPAGRRYDEVVEPMEASLAKASPWATPPSAPTMMGPLIHAAQRTAVEQYVAAGTAEGARLACGGNRPPRTSTRVRSHSPPCSPTSTSSDERGPGRDLRAGRAWPSPSTARTRGPHRQRQPLRPGRLGLRPLIVWGVGAGPAHPGRHRVDQRWRGRAQPGPARSAATSTPASAWSTATTASLEYAQLKTVNIPPTMERLFAANVTKTRISGNIGADDPYWESLQAGLFRLPAAPGSGRWTWPAHWRCGAAGGGSSDGTSRCRPGRSTPGPAPGTP